MKKIAVLSLSGGMDSSTLLLRLLREEYDVIALSFDYGQKHRVELQMASELVRYLKSSHFNIEHKIIDLTTLSSLLESTLISGKGEVPEGHYQEESMKETVVPNRNKIFSSIIQAVALSAYNQNPGSRVEIAMGIHSGDHAIYPDCTDEFRQIDYHAFVAGNWNAESILFYAPYIESSKTEVLSDGIESCKILGVSFDEVYSRTCTSYKPIFDRKTGLWYSDFKSGSSVERVESFMKLGKVDPIKYAVIDRNGVVKMVPWNDVCEYVSVILDERNRVK